MSYRAKAFPYPVMSPHSSDFGNDVEFALDVVPEVIGGDESQQIRVSYEFGRHSSEWLGQYVESGMAEYVIDIACSETRFRDFWRVGHPVGHREFEPGELAGTVEVTPMIVAAVANPEYQPSGIDREFGSHSFAVDAGDVLAFGHTTTFTIGFNAGADRGLLTIRFTPDPEYFNNYRFELGGDRIIINAGESLREPIARVQSIGVQLLYMGMFKDCIASALEYLAEDGEWEDTSHAWGKTLLARIDELGLDVSPDEDREKFEVIAQRLVADRWIHAVAVLNG
ncbi:hypothetical protein R2Q81_07090 [Microbacterium aquimaris]|uniref:hypothetical protein n=1 Tax=Microbacterium aquimaris TaxID=459816 RepID=UPI002AD4D8E4|nr:hypothetical protein [Microbacterium aquimaris]MDZ8275714.1 hypothetical protein [Microbacterium aquimaris]